MSKIVVADQNGVVVGLIRLINQKFKFFKPEFLINDSNRINTAKITGDGKAWNFPVFNQAGAEMGKISKKWAGTYNRTQS